MSNRPYIGKVWIQDWTDLHTGEVTPGIKLGGAGGIAAHLTPGEARTLADKLHDLADKMESHCALQEDRPVAVDVPKPVLRRITAADGTEEPALPSTAPEAAPTPAPAKRRVIRRLNLDAKKGYPWNL